MNDQREKDGAVFPVEIRASHYVRNAPVRLSTVRDISGALNVEDALRLNEQRLRQIIDLVPHFIFAKDIEGRFILVNQAVAEAYGTTVKDLTGKTDADFAKSDAEVEHFRNDDLEVIKSGAPKYIPEETITDANGQTRTLTTTKIPFTYSGTTMPAVLGVSANITDRKQIEEALRLNAQRLRQSEEQFRRVVEHINDALVVDDRDGRIIFANERFFSLFGFRREESDRIRIEACATPVFESTSMNTIIVDILKLFQETFPKTIIVNTDLLKNLPPIIADVTQIHQVLLNLCVNARDAMPLGGTLRISTTTVPIGKIVANHPQAASPEYVLLHVADTGIGMDETTKQRVFEPFFTTKGAGKGTGLGLSLVYGIIAGHNGFIEVESEIGKGTSFSVYLPAGHHDAATQSADDRAQQTSTGGSETILVIEDETMLSELVEMILSAKGYKVLLAPDGEAGIAMFRARRNEIDLVISDLGLPKIGGDRVFRKIREIDPKAKVIIASGFIEAALKNELAREGVRQFIQKPYSPDQVLDVVRMALEGV